jgi:hypothetical protein
MAWQRITPVTTKGFKNCRTSNAVDGNNDMLWNESEEDRNVRSVCVEDEGT